MASSIRSTLHRYGMAAVAAVLAMAARLALDPLLGDGYPLVTFFVALVFAAWYGGFGPSLLAMALSCGAIQYIVHRQGVPAIPGLENQVGYALYLVAGLMMAAMGGSMRVAQERAEAAAGRSREESLRLGREMAERHRAEGENRRLLAEQRRLTAVAMEQSVTLSEVFDQAPVGIILLDGDLRYVRANAHAAGLTGHQPDELPGRTLGEVVAESFGADSAAEVTARVRQTLETGEPFQVKGWTSDHRRRSGEPYHADWAVRRIDRPGGGVIGLLVTAVEVTEHVERGRALAESEARFRQLADTMPQIVWVTGPDQSLRYLNRRWVEYTGIGLEESYHPQGWRPPIHPDDVEAVLRESARAAASGEPFEAEYRLRGRDGSYRWHLGRSVEVRDESGAVVARFGTATDIDDRRRAEQAARFVAEAGSALAALVDESSALQTVANLAVPAFADWCTVDLAGEDGIPRRLTVAHVDPAKVELAHEVYRRYPPDPDAPSGLARVIRTGEPLLVPTITDEMLEAGAVDAEQLRIWRELGLRSFLCVPLIGRGRPIGALSFVAAESGRIYGEADLRLAEDLSRRATVAIENARLYGELKQADRRKDELVATLAESEDRFRTLADSIPQLAWMARPDGHLFWYNRRWYDYTGSTAEQMEGDGWTAVHDPDRLPGVIARFEQALASGQPWEDTFPLRRHDGEMRWHLSRALPLRDDQGRISRWFGTNTDITDRRRMEEALKEADRRKDVFLATLAHELRNPLAPIRNALKLMEGTADGPIEPERAMAERQVAHLARLVDDLMDLSRINRGKVELRKEVLTLGRVVERAVGSVRSAARERGHELTVSLPEESIRLEADPTRLEQILGNLLSNAVKYTEPGGRIRLEAGRDGAEVVIRVVDTGIGIEPEVLPRVFEMFVQAEHLVGRSQGGLGIGLSLVHDLVELHGGSIAARSEGPGRGSEFVLRLPALPAIELGPDQPERPSPEPVARRAADRPARRRVLVVDDNVDAATSLARVLSRLYGQDVEVAHDGSSALEAARRTRPEVILMDIGMPGMDGYEVARRLRARPEFGRTLIVALTGWGQDQDREKSREAGFDRHLVKPVDPDAIRGLLVGDELAAG